MNKLEDLFSESDYILRYEKGNFKSGYCLLLEKKIVIVNKYYTLEGKIDSLIKIVKEEIISTDKMSEKNSTFYQQLIKIQ